jgi:hypothetical protein
MAMNPENSLPGDGTPFLPEVASIDRDSIVAILEREAMRRLGIPAGLMLELNANGELKNPGQVGDLLVLADLLAEDDPLVVSRRR